MKKIFILLLILPLFAFSEEETPFPSGRTAAGTADLNDQYGHSTDQLEARSTAVGTGPETCSFCVAKDAPDMASTKTNFTPDRASVDPKSKKVKTGE